MSDSRYRRQRKITGDSPSAGYRLLVGATKHGAKSFGWAIVRNDDNDRVPIMQSTVTFRSLADAHAAGSIALEKFRAHEAMTAERPAG
jgi:hypothetical protein